MVKRNSAILAFLSIVLLALVGCGGDDDDGPLGACPDDSTADQVMGAMLLAANCQGCHSMDAAMRNGAPADANFDTAAQVMAAAESIYDRVERGNMPPSGALSAADQELVRVYLACGASQEPTAN